MASLKKDTEGHKLRYKILESCGEHLTTVFGTENSQFKDRIDCLRDFQYVIEIQNCKRDFYFTERPVDAFLTGTVPIFWGCPSFNKFFSDYGFLTFDNVSQLRDILITIGDLDYEKRLPAINQNFIRAHRYISMEDYIYIHFIRNIQLGVPVCRLQF